ncbi:MAG: hypothetical protein O2967_22740 [Proteobacteria bacterium]|nr:hypothetical protein [Pseudomonadota bacterium]
MASWHRAALERRNAVNRNLELLALRVFAARAQPGRIVGQEAFRTR